MIDTAICSNNESCNKSQVNADKMENECDKLRREIAYYRNMCDEARFDIDIFNSVWEWEERDKAEKRLRYAKEQVRTLTNTEREMCK